MPSRLTQHLDRLNSSSVWHGDMSSATNVLFKLSCPSCVAPRRGLCPSPSPAVPEETSSSPPSPRSAPNLSNIYEDCCVLNAFPSTSGGRSSFLCLEAEAAVLKLVKCNGTEGHYFSVERDHRISALFVREYNKAQCYGRGSPTLPCFSIAVCYQKLQSRDELEQHLFDAVCVLNLSI